MSGCVFMIFYETIQVTTVQYAIPEFLVFLLIVQICVHLPVYYKLRMYADLKLYDTDAQDVSGLHSHSIYPLNLFNIS